MHFLMTSVMPVCGADGPQDEALQRQLMSMGNLLRWRRNEELICGFSSLSDTLFFNKFFLMNP